MSEAPGRTQTPSHGPSDVPGPAPIGATWELVETIDDGEVLDVAKGPSGWVAGGWVKCPHPGCRGAAAATWFSPDGISWTGGPISDGAGAPIVTVATDGDRWFAAGVGSEGDGDNARLKALIWRSAHGRDWRLVGSIPLGPPSKGVGSVGQLVAGPSGVILTRVDPEDPDHPERSTVYWSENGTTWLPIDKAIFGLSPDGFGLSTAIVVDGRFVVVGTNDAGTVWSSSDGRDWTLDASFGASAGVGVASDGRRVMVVDEQCAADCEFRIWISEDGRTGWTRSPQVLGVGEPWVAYAAGTFIVAGEIDGGDDANRGVHIFTSPDGTTWTEFKTDLLLDSCYTAALVGAEDRVVLAGDEACSGIWVSRAPGAVSTRLP
ncbi:MAG: hypothetical protein FIA92_06805 [Chloroflexi bacterium]|nr:hypothetical protein [Chloroflexota bacterium]